ncbi:MAG: hypothetical protein ABJM43_06050 [Paracoccaceae bacterium]
MRVIRPDIWRINTFVGVLVPCFQGKPTIKELFVIWVGIRVDLL